MKPVWLLDIDGVINAIAKKGDPSVWDEWRSAIILNDLGKWPVLWAPAVVRFIREVHESGRAEIRWHTTWQRDAWKLEEILCLPRFEVAEAPEFADRTFTARAIRERRPPWWKLPAAERVVLEERRHLIWTDDDINKELARYPSDMYDTGRVISPKQNIGLTPKALEVIDTFLSSC